MRKFLILFLFSFFAGNSQEEVLLHNESGVFTTEVTLNSRVRTEFIVDTGCSISSIPYYIALTLYQTGTIKTSDLMEDSTAILADGSRVQVHHFRMRTLKIGHTVLKNVEFAVVMNESSPLLLGQNVLSRLEKVTIDYKRKKLIYGKTRSSKSFVSRKKRTRR